MTQSLRLQRQAEAELVEKVKVLQQRCDTLHKQTQAAVKSGALACRCAYWFSMRSANTRAGQEHRYFQRLTAATAKHALHVFRQLSAL